MTDQRTHVVVIGGGYAGTLAANHLRQRADVDITAGQSASGLRRANPAAPAGRRHRRRDRRLRHAARRRHPAGRRQRRPDRHGSRQPSC